MFRGKTKELEKFADENPRRIEELENLFIGNTNVYIDWANVYGWQDRLKWKIHPRKICEFYSCFQNVGIPKLYFGTDRKDSRSLKGGEKFKKWGFDFKTKSVKHMNLSINANSIPLDSVDILKNFIRAPLLKTLKISTIELLNKELRLLNSQGLLYLEDLKCNFDVEIGRDMLVDFEHNNTDTYILWSGDSDFADAIQQLLEDGRNVVLFMTVNKVAAELNKLKKSGLKMFEINKIRDAICKDRYHSDKAKGA